jgi:hypothetical protein
MIEPVPRHHSRKKNNTVLILLVLALLGLFLLNRTRQAAALHPQRIAAH